MGWTLGIAIYFILWWLALFVVLPIGVRVPDEVESGHATSAPARARLWLKAGIATVLAGLLWIVAYLIITSDLIPIRDAVGG